MCVCVPQRPLTGVVLTAGTLANGIQDLGLGIDVFKLNPLATDAPGRTAGIGPQKVIDVNYFADSAACLAAGTVDVNIATFAEPDGVTISNQPGCSTDTSSVELTSVEEYTSQLAASATVSASARSLSSSGGFTASVAFARVEDSIVNEQSFFASTTTICTAYKAALTFTPDHTFGRGFTSQVEALPTTFDESTKPDFFSFYDNFGTHILFGMTTGSRHGDEVELKSTAREELEAQGLTVDFAANAKTKAGLFSGEASVQASLDVFTSAATALDKVSKSSSSYAFGPPPGNLGYDEAVRSLPSRLAAPRLPAQYILLHLHMHTCSATSMLTRV